MNNRLYLKVKIKNLADEARLIRWEATRQKKLRLKERGTNHQEFIDGLHVHRTQVVRPAAREAHLAYGFLKGKQYLQIENSAKSVPNWKNVEKMVTKYGGNGPYTVASSKVLEVFKEWHP